MPPRACAPVERGVHSSDNSRAAPHTAHTGDIDMTTRTPRGFDLALAHAHLRSSDARLARWMHRIGPLEFDFNARFHTVDALARSILHQQLSGKAAATITARVVALMPRAQISAAGLQALPDAALRGAGVSGNKLAALRDLGARAQAGAIPGAAALERMSDADIIAALTPVRGIGRWTVEMLLMFRLGRPDVLPLDDLGVRQGAALVDGLEMAPNARALAARGACWAPYRSLAGFYLWRVVEHARRDHA